MLDRYVVPFEQRLFIRFRGANYIRIVRVHDSKQIIRVDRKKEIPFC